MITSGISALRSTGSTMWLPYAMLGQFDEAWRCVGEAKIAMDVTKERWCEAEIDRMAGEIVLLSPQQDAAKAEAYFEHALAVARKQQTILGATRLYEPRTSLARPGQGAASARTACSGVRVVYGGGGRRSIQSARPQGAREKRRDASSSNPIKDTWRSVKAAPIPVSGSDSRSGLRQFARRRSEQAVGSPAN
jgi:hypothetical protein